MAGLVPLLVRHARVDGALLCTSCCRRNATTSKLIFQSKKDTGNDPVSKLRFEEYRKLKKKISRWSKGCGAVVGGISSTAVCGAVMVMYPNLFQGTPEEIPLVL